MLNKMKIPAVLVACLIFCLTGCDMDQPTGPGDQPSVGDVLINEIVASNDTGAQDPDHGDFADWVELYNKGTVEENVSGWTIADSGAEWTIPDGTTIGAGGYLVIWCDDLDETGLGLHSNFKLGSGGDELTLKNGTGQYRDGYAFGAQTTDVSIGRTPDGADNWAAQDAPSPGAANGDAADPVVTVFINEFMASNDATIADPDYAEFGDWIELYNPGAADADIGGWTMTDDLLDPIQWVVPAGTLVPAGGYLLIWADKNDPTTTALHANFKLGGSGEEIGLYEADGTIVDTLVYDEQRADVSYGRIPDGGAAWGFLETATPAAENSGVAPVYYGLFINEYIASNDTGAQDPDYADFSDWIELYNETGTDLDISGWTMTDDLLDVTQWEVPAGTIVPAEGYLIIWADGLNEVALGIHADFKLGGGGEEIGIYDPDLVEVDAFAYDAQTTDISSGRQPDGSDTWVTFVVPTPGASNN
jgi:hypothetical protein